MIIRSLLLTLRFAISRLRPRSSLPQQVVLEGQKFALGPVVVVGLELEKKSKNEGISLEVSNFMFVVVVP
jgi:hypothetical protein